MSWTSMHFAVGMGCAGVLTAGICAVRGNRGGNRGWRWLPLAMTLGGCWAQVPDMPRLWRVDFPWLPFASTLGAMSLEKTLHAWGDIFFFHHWMDGHLKNMALVGLGLVLLFYNASIVLLMFMEQRARAAGGRQAQPLAGRSAAFNGPRLVGAEDESGYVSPGAAGKAKVEESDDGPAVIRKLMVEEETRKSV